MAAGRFGQSVSGIESNGERKPDLLVGEVGTGSAWGAEERVTFTKDILPIMQEKCQVCHRPSGNNIAGLHEPIAAPEIADKTASFTY